MAINAKILVVDDEPKMLDILSKFLDNEGCQVETARDGETALEKVASFKPECVLLDIKIPKRDGLEVLKEIKTNFPHIIVIVVSAVREFTIIQNCLRGGAFTHMLKPVDMEDLRRAIKESLGQILEEREERRFEKKREEMDSKGTKSKKSNKHRLDAVIELLEDAGIVTKEQVLERAKRITENYER